jgi:hypothetical protein
VLKGWLGGRNTAWVSLETRSGTVLRKSHVSGHGLPLVAFVPDHPLKLTLQSKNRAVGTSVRDLALCTFRTQKFRCCKAPDLFSVGQTEPCRFNRLVLDFRKPSLAEPPPNLRLLEEASIWSMEPLLCNLAGHFQRAGWSAAMTS